MIAVENIPSELEEILYTFTDWFFKQDRSGFDIKKQPITREEAISIEYLKTQQASDHEGFPVCSEGIDFNTMRGFDLDKFWPAISETDGAIKTYLGSRTNAIKIYYPAGGYIDWHHNGNAYGYNALFSYSETGDGAFMYQHPITKDIITIPDKKGWNMKIGVYDTHDGNPLWHAAYTNCARLTWGYILDQSGWDNLKEELGVDVSPIEQMLGGTMPSYKEESFFKTAPL
jgi:hypothetical protein